MQKSVRSALLLLLTAMIWGSGFVAQSTAAECLSPFTIGALRNLIGCIFLSPVIYLIDKRDKRSADYMMPTQKHNKMLVLGGISCGIALAVASTFQQMGVPLTTVGKAGFITALYIVIVPIFGVFLKKKTPAVIWLAVAVAVGGMYLLCINGELSIGRGDLYVLICAMCFAAHILIIDHFSPHVNGVKMAFIQFATCSAICAVCALIFEHPNVRNILSMALPIVYLGVMSTGVGYTLQVVSQKNIQPEIASLIMSLEAVFAALLGWLLLNEHLNAKELVGCALIFAAVMLAQLPDFIRRGNRNDLSVQSNDRTN